MVYYFLLYLILLIELFYNKFYYLILYSLLFYSILSPSILFFSLQFSSILSSSILSTSIQFIRLLFHKIYTLGVGGINLGEPLPYGTHHIDPKKCESKGGLLAEFILNSKGLLTKKAFQASNEIDCKKENSNDPAVRLAFATRLDTETRSIQDRQVCKHSLLPYHL